MTTTKLGKPLKIGERCAILIKPRKKQRDAFGRLKTDYWEPCEVQRVTKIKQKDPSRAARIVVSTASNVQETVAWTADSFSPVQRLLPGTDGSSEHLEMNPAIRRVPAPTELKPGDGVVGWFQQGLEASYYQGRVAAVHGEKCSIAYDDGDWEDGIPYQSKQPCAAVIRFSNGWEEPQWMVGMQVQCQSRKGHGSRATIVTAETFGPVWLKYPGQETKEKRPYQMIAQSVMNEARDKAKRKFVWDNAGSSDLTDSVDDDPVDTCHGGNLKNKPASTTPGDDAETSFNVSFDTATSNPCQDRVSKLNDSNDSSFRLSLESAHSEELCGDGDTPRATTRSTRPKRTTATAHKTWSPSSSDDDSDTDKEEPSKKKRKTTCRSSKRMPSTRRNRGHSLKLATSSAKEGQDEPEKTTNKAKGATSTTKKPNSEDDRKDPPPSNNSTNSKASSIESNANSEKETGLGASLSTGNSKHAATSSSSRAPSQKGPARTMKVGAPTKPRMRKATRINGDPPCVPESDTEDAFQWTWPEVSCLATQDQNPRKPTIPFSFASAIRRQWQSSASQYAADAMGHAQSHHGLVPEQWLQEDIDHQMLRGQPQSDPKTSFADCHRMELANEVVRNANISWTDFWDQMMSPLYTAEGDDRRLTKFAIERIATSAHAKSITASRFLLNGDCDYPCAPKSWREDIDSYKEKGCREAFRVAVDAYLSLWTSYGHFYLVTKWEIEDVSPDERVFVQRNVKQLLQSLGKAVSYAAQVYGVETGENDMSLAYFLFERIEAKLQDFTITKELAGGCNWEYLKDRMKLRMVLDLDRKILPNVRRLLAQHLGFAERYNLIFATGTST